MAKFVPRQRKHKVLARERAKENARHQVEDTNQTVLPAKEQQLADKRARLKEDLRQGGVKVSGKKAKRLEKYIDSKLRKEENRELLAKLAERKVDTSLFTSSKSIGHGKETKRQALSRALREQRAGVGAKELQDGILYEKRPDFEEENGSTGDEESEVTNGGFEDEVEAGRRDNTLSRIKAASGRDNSTQSSSSQNPTLTAPGSGLKRPMELDGHGYPVIQKRQKRGGVKSKLSTLQSTRQIDGEGSNDDEACEDWNGFSSDEGRDSQASDLDSDGNSSALDNRASSSAASEDESGQEHAEASESDSTGQSDPDEDGRNGLTSERSSAFKTWAHHQRNEALGYQPVANESGLFAALKPQAFAPRVPEQDPLPMELQPTENTSRKVFSVIVNRTPEVQEARLKLPVVAEEQRLMEAIHNHNVVVICGSTGSGKTTQVPQFLYEAGYGSPDSPTPGLIGITQPRRVAAVSMSRRVADELGDRSAAVAYQIRFEGTVDAKTSVKFMTDGVLLREIAQDFALRKYSAIIIDEAHERSVNTDILIGMLSRVVKLRTELAQEDSKLKALKLIIMSATLRIEDLTMNPTLFSTPPPVLQVEGRQHPVTVHFSRRTSHDYVEEAFKKVCRGHRKLPPGGFLVFLTGRNEILHLGKRLKAAFGGLRSADGPRVQISASEAPMEVEDIEFGDVNDNTADSNYDDELLEEDESAEDEFVVEECQQEAPLKAQILPLYSLLSTREQLRVFEPPAEGTRQIVLATNVAETSLTIPGTRFVFDCGRSKERRYDRLSGVQSYEIGWISKASASQRSGRAGRTGPGHCYRLYSSAVYERDFAEFADPELLRMPIEGVVLQLKAMNLQHVVNFPFPTPPERQSLAKAERILTYLSALSPEGQITQAGSTMAVFPLSPRFARILLVGHLHDCLPYTIAVVAGMSAAEVFVPDSQAIPDLAAKDDATIRTNSDVLAEDRQANIRRMFNEVHRNFCFLDDRSDAIKLLQVVGEFAHEPTEEWCERHFVRCKVLREIQQLRRQVTDLLKANIPSFANLHYQDQLDPPTPKQVSALKQMVAAGFLDQVAMRADLAPNPPEQHRKPRRAIDVPYIPLVPLPTARGMGSEPFVYIHPTSPLAHLSTQECPEYIVYAYLQRAAAPGLDPEKAPKTRMHSLTNISGGQLAGLAKGTPLLSYGKPIKEVKGAAAADGGLVRECWVVPYLRAEGTVGQGWPMPAQKVKQRKIPGKGWVVQ